MSPESQLEDLMTMSELKGHVLNQDDIDFISDCETFLYETGNLSPEQEDRIERLYEEYFNEIEGE